MASKWTQEKVEERLIPAMKELGTGPNKVAEALLAKKCKGVRQSSDGCPFAIFVQKTFKSATEVSVDQNEITLTLGDQTFTVEPTKAVAKFIDKFDDDDEEKQAYPELAIAGED